MCGKLPLLFPSSLPVCRESGNKRNWTVALEYIAAHPELDEIIFSGGDPLMAKDHELDWLLTQLEAIKHVKRLRIHSRLPIVIPARITDELVARFDQSRLQILLVNHINHANEVDEAFGGDEETAPRGRHASQPERPAAWRE